MNNAVYSRAYEALLQREAREKSVAVDEMVRLLAEPSADSAPGCRVQQIPQPGCPRSVRLVDPRHVERRNLSTERGRACFLHAVAHIEFNAINLALDAIYRFRDLPAAYYRDWLQVAGDEARHHQLVIDRVQELGFDYGDFPAHNGLWDIARRTTDSVLSRMGLVPCVLEARGLDVTPTMVKKLGDAGEHKGAAILQQILDEEVAHVAIGVHWFRYACTQGGKEPVSEFLRLLRERLPGRRQGPLNTQQRLEAGFTPEWLEAIENLV